MTLPPVEEARGIGAPDRIGTNRQWEPGPTGRQRALPETGAQARPLNVTTAEVHGRTPSGPRGRRMLSDLFRDANRSGGELFHEPNERDSPGQRELAEIEPDRFDLCDCKQQSRRGSRPDRQRSPIVFGASRPSVKS